MKTNGTKRKIFNDTVDLLAGAEEVSAPKSGIWMLPIDSIRPFRSYPFRLYEGECLEDMVESISEHGILNPVIVWQEGEGYEMLAGLAEKGKIRLDAKTAKCVRAWLEM